MKTPHEELLEKVVDMIYGSYDPNEISKEQQEENIKSFREKIIKWKIDPKTRKILGNLQPAKLLSQMSKVPESEVTKIMSELNLSLPEKPNMKEFNIDMIPESEVLKILENLKKNPDDEESIMDILAAMEKQSDTEFSPQSFQFFDMTDKDAKLSELEEDVGSNLYHMICYIESIIERIKKGEIKTVSIVSILEDGKASVYLPPAMADQIDVYSPIIDLLRVYGTPTEVN